ncbi:dynein axonemal heavy chain 9-like [Patagioenas fasciata]|uniref:dynein axonemal heavy chain 9-like n=1 Tax=Patagioenas fasciata TaxID=372321 RepID=UPI003A997898
MERIDKSLVYAMESAIIDWSHQIQEALKKESSEPLLQGSNPNPKVELEFWKNRCDDLECIYNQLTTRKVRNMMELLERVESSYIPAFKTMLMDVEAALTEAQDVHLRLTPLKRRLEDVERVEFSEVKPFLLPLLHVVCLIWVTSKHYNMPVRIVVLLQEICNLLIEQALVYLSPEDLLKGDMEESLGKVRMVLGILNMFKEAFEERREKLHMYYEPGQEVREWDFSSTMVFARLDTFLKRLEMVENVPPVAGALRWAQELRARIQVPFDHFRHIPHLCLDSAEGRRVIEKYEEMIQLLDRYQEKLYADWSQTVSEKSQYNLTQPLIRRDPETKLITVTFDPQLVSVLRELSYLSGSRLGAIPPTAAEIYSSKESYRQLAANLELMGNRYNKVLKTVLEVEYPLIQEQLWDINLKLKKAEETLNWKMEGVWDHISMVMDDVHDLEQRIQKAKNNVEEIQTIVGSWASPIFVRRDCKRESLLSLEDCQDRLERRYSLVRESGQRIHLLVKVRGDLLQGFVDSS